MDTEWASLFIFGILIINARGIPTEKAKLVATKAISRTVYDLSDIFSMEFWRTV